MSFIFGVLTVLALVIGTSFAFAVINLVLFKIDPTNFELVSKPSFFKFIYYSFNTLVFSGIKEIDPASTVAQAASMAEKFLALFLIGIFAASMISIRSQRYSDQLNAVIEGLENDGLIIEGFIRDEYRINSIDEALLELERLKASLGFILGSGAARRPAFVRRRDGCLLALTARGIRPACMLVINHADTVLSAPTISFSADTVRFDNGRISSSVCSDGDYVFR
jgi:hypothetical protein